MRRRLALLLTALVVGAGCGVSGNSAEPAPTTVAPTPTETASPTPTGPELPSTIDIVPTLLNLDGEAPCGFQTAVTDMGALKIMDLKFGVAVGATSELAQIAPNHSMISVRYDWAGEPPPASSYRLGASASFNHAGKLTSGTYIGELNTPAPYVRVLYAGTFRVHNNQTGQWVHPVDSPTWPQWLRLTHTVRVTVDPDNRIHESDESNNTLTLMVKVPTTTTFEIADSSCTVAT